jgi:DNA-binding beta-propeller fold protein YncE
MLSAALLLPAAVVPGEEMQDPQAESQQTAKEGILLGFTIVPLEPGGGLVEYADAVVEFAISDSASGIPLRGLYPLAWMDNQRPGQSALSCAEKVRSYLSGRLAFRPQLDLSTWHLLTLNDKASITVIDPLIDLSGTQMLALVLLDSPGEDWALSDDALRLFVTLPDSDQVAVIDTRRWAVEAKPDAGPQPRRALLQPDGQYLWVGNDAAAPDGGVTVIDARTLEVAARLTLGGGRHDLAVSDDDRIAAVTSSEDKSVALIDVRELALTRRVELGGRPVAVDYSSRAKAFVVADEEWGVITVVDAEALEVRARVGTAPGLATVRVSPDGRWAFALNRVESRAYVIDLATAELRHEVTVGPAPDHVAFSTAYAYVRALGSERVSLIGFTELERDEAPPVIEIPAGQRAPGDDPGSLATASPIIATPEPGTVLIANPQDEMVYYYGEGMAAPMGGLRNFRRQARAALVVDRSLREVAPGRYATTVRLPSYGVYDVALLIDNPRLYHCFTATVQPDPAVRRQAEAKQHHIEYLLDRREVAAGEGYRLRFKLTTGSTGVPPAGADVRVLNVLIPGTWQERAWATPLGEGVYEAELSIPREGRYRVYVEVPALGITYRDLPYLSLRGADGVAQDG